MAQSRPTFGYWPIRAGPRGNVNRYILGYAGVDFEDHRFTKEEWDSSKNNLGLDFPNLPHIIDGDFKLSESKAVTVYICDRWAPDLMGSTPEERATVIMIQQVAIDAFMAGAGSAFSNPDKEVLFEKIAAALGPLATYLGDKSFLHGNSVRMTDFILWELIETGNAAAGDDRLGQQYPKLKAFHERVLALPTFAAYWNSDKALKAPFFPPAFAKVQM